MSEGSGRWIVKTRLNWDETPTPDWKLWLPSVALSALVSIALGFLVERHAGMRGFFMEDGPIETLQAGLLLAVAAVFAAAFARSAGSRAVFCLLAAYGCIFALTREIPRCGSAFTGGGACLTSTWKESIVLLASVLGLTALILRPTDWRDATRLSNLRWTWPSLVVVAFLVAAEGLEHLIYYSEIEEFLELAAYLHLGTWAVSILRRTHAN